MVFDDIRLHLPGVVDLERPGFHGRGYGCFGQSRTDEPDRCTLTFSRFGKASAGAGYALVLFRLFAVPDCLVGEFAGGDSLVSAENKWRLGCNRAGGYRASFCVSVSVPVVALVEA